MPMYKETVERRLAELSTLLDLKMSGIAINEHYDRPSFFIERLAWMLKFHHIDRKTYDKFVDRVATAFEIE